MTAPQRLVVIGNGMAGARFVEELLARGGGDRFEIVMFGDEPYGNYNRILLSGVLAGTQEPEDIFINPLEWYERERRHAARRRRRRRASTARRRSSAAPTAGPSPTTRSSSPPAAVPFVPPLENLAPTEPAHGTELQGRRLRLPHARRLRAHAGPRRRREAAAVIGGGLLGLEAARGLSSRGLEVTSSTSMAPDGDAARRDAGLMLQQVDGTDGGEGAPRQVHDRPCSATAPSPACVRRRLDASSATWSSSPPASARTSRWRVDAGLDGRARHRRRRRAAPPATRTSTRSASARSTAAWSTASSRRSGSRRRCWPTG